MSPPMPPPRWRKRSFSFKKAASPAARELEEAMRQLEALVDSVASRGELESRRAELEEAREKIVRMWVQLYGKRSYTPDTLSRFDDEPVN